MLDKVRKKDTLASWCKRNGIDLGEEHEYVIGYWCRVSGVPLADEAKRRDFDESGYALDGWKDGDQEIRAEAEEIARTA